MKLTRSGTLRCKYNNEEIKSIVRRQRLNNMDVNNELHGKFVASIFRIWEYTYVLRYHLEGMRLHALTTLARRRVTVIHRKM